MVQSVTMGHYHHEWTRADGAQDIHIDTEMTLHEFESLARSWHDEATRSPLTDRYNRCGLTVEIVHLFEGRESDWTQERVEFCQDAGC